MLFKNIFFVCALLIFYGIPSNAQIDVRSGGCIGPCNIAGCCNQTIILNPKGVGLARDFNCRSFMEQGSAVERQVICKQLRAKNALALCSEIAAFCKPQEDTACPDPLQEEAAKKILQAIYPGIRLPAKLSPGATIFAFEALRRLNEASRITTGLSKLLPTKPIRSLSQIGKILAKAAIESLKDYRNNKENLTVRNVILTRQRELKLHLDSQIKAGTTCEREFDPPEFPYQF